MSQRGSTTAVRRLLKEFKELSLHAPDGILAAPMSETQLFQWEAVVLGPEGTAYEHGVYEAVLAFPQDYPLSPPTMRFTTDLYHPNSMTFG
jgi:ubiquitin-conjugating enzyme E2 G2